MVPTRSHRRRTVALAAFISTVLLATAACSSDKPTSSGNGSGSSSSDAGSVLGSPNKATGTPIKIGFVYDGPGAAGDATDNFTGGKVAAQYANDFLGGINGHPIDLQGCDTTNTPAGGTQCAITLTNDKVAAVVTGSSTYDAPVFQGLSES